MTEEKKITKQEADNIIKQHYDTLEGIVGSTFVKRARQHINDAFEMGSSVLGYQQGSTQYHSMCYRIEFDLIGQISNVIEKLTNGNDGIPPKLKSLGILPTIK